MLNFHDIAYPYLHSSLGITAVSALFCIIYQEDLAGPLMFH